MRSEPQRRVPEEGSPPRQASIGLDTTSDAYEHTGHVVACWCRRPHNVTYSYSPRAGARRGGRQGQRGGLRAGGRARANHCCHNHFCHNNCCHKYCCHNHIIARALPGPPHSIPPHHPHLITSSRQFSSHSPPLLRWARLGSSMRTRKSACAWPSCEVYRGGGRPGGQARRYTIVCRAARQCISLEQLHSILQLDAV